MPTTMTRSEREEFLAGVHVGILSVNQPPHGPLTVPVWYSSVPGGPVSVMSPAQSQKALCINESGRFSLCVQSEAPPYKHVSVEGPPAATVAQSEGEVTYRMMPEVWRTAGILKAMT